MDWLEEFAQAVRDGSGGAFDGASTAVIVAMGVVAFLLLIVSGVAAINSLVLFFSYIKYNNTQNSVGLPGKEIARQVLDKHGLQDIGVSACGSLLFGNSYSHYFKKVRLRRLTWKKDSISSLAMAVQKSSLAILDHEGDRDMKTRVALTPWIYFGPLAFIPLVLLGIVLDAFIFTSSNGLWTMLLTGVGLALYVVAFVMALVVLKTEKKAQAKALEIMRADNLATDDEIAMCQDLFRLYNIEYVNDMITALLELVYRVLQIVASARSSSKSSSHR